MKIPPRPDPGLKELQALARTASRRWPGLAPRGGSRWTAEDVDRCVSILFEVSRSRAFLAAFPAGARGRRCHGYLRKALHNELVDLRDRARRLPLVDPLALDSLPKPSNGASDLAREDILAFARRLIEWLPDHAAGELARRLQVPRPPGAARGDDSAGNSPATRKRHRAGAKAVIKGFARDERLTREEMGQVLSVVSSRLGGAGGRRGKSDTET